MMLDHIFLLSCLLPLHSQMPFQNWSTGCCYGITWLLLYLIGTTQEGLVVGQETSPELLYPCCNNACQSVCLIPNPYFHPWTPELGNTCTPISCPPDHTIELNWYYNYQYCTASQLVHSLHLGCCHANELDVVSQHLLLIHVTSTLWSNSLFVPVSLIVSLPGSYLG